MRLRPLRSPRALMARRRLFNSFSPVFTTKKTQVRFANLHPSKQTCWGPRLGHPKLFHSFLPFPSIHAK
jgi:hypothetical protein